MALARLGVSQFNLCLCKVLDHRVNILTALTPRPEHQTCHPAISHEAPLLGLFAWVAEGHQAGPEVVEVCHCFFVQYRKYRKYRI